MSQKTREREGLELWIKGITCYQGNGQGALMAEPFQVERSERAPCNCGLMRTSDEEVVQRTASWEVKKKKSFNEDTWFGGESKNWGAWRRRRDSEQTSGAATGKKWWGDRESGKVSLDLR